MKKRIAIITARGGSKRIPHKNIKEFCGKPIIEYSIRAALDSNLFSEVMVSTDDEKIADISKKAGANVPFFRSEKTSGDFATTDDVLREVVGEYKNRGMEFDELVCIYPTAPFVTADKLAEAFDVMERTGADAVTPVVRFSFPPQRAFVIENDLLKYQYPENAFVRSQDLIPVYHDCGQFYVLKVSNFDKRPEQVKIAPVVVSELEVQDIDNEDDWKMAEIKFQLMHDKVSGGQHE